MVKLCPGHRRATGLTETQLTNIRSQDGTANHSRWLGTASTAPQKKRGTIPHPKGITNLLPPTDDLPELCTPDFQAKVPLLRFTSEKRHSTFSNCLLNCEGKEMILVVGSPVAFHCFAALQIEFPIAFPT